MIIPIKTCRSGLCLLTLKPIPTGVIANTMRYDLVAQRAATAGINFSYNNECASFDFAVHRRFTDIGSSPPINKI